MAKKSIKNYVFYPGLGLEDNLYPNAYSLIEQNYEFIKKEVAAWIGAQVAAGNPDFLFNRAKCIRDLGYIVEGVRYDMALGTNYNAVFQGRAESNSQEISPTVIEAIRNAEARILTLASVSQDTTAIARIEAAFDEIVDVAQNGPVSADTVTYTNPTSANAVNIAANEKITENLAFIQAEVNAWVNVNYPDHDHDVAKCSRDVKYALEALAYDILYGGNSASYDSARFFYYFDAANNPGIDPTHVAQTAAAYNHISTIIGDIVGGVAITPSAGNNETQVTAGNTSDGSLVATLQGLLQIVEDVVNDGTDALDSYTRTVPAVTWATSTLQNAFSEIAGQANTIIAAVTPPAAYTYDSEKCERDTAFNLTAYLHDLRYDGNEETTRIAKTYWEYDVAQVDGYRIPEIRAKEFTRNLITNNVLTNIPQTTPYQTQLAQVIDTSKTAEDNAPSRIQTLVNLVRDVIESGTGALPTFERKGLGHIKFQGNYDLSDVLLVTNTTKNEIIYNFGDPKRGATLVQTNDDTPRDSSGYLVKYDYTDANRDADGDFPKFLQTTDTIVTLNLVYNTSTHSSEDSLQIFVEKIENGESVTVTRPYAFGTDAIERQRVAPPLSMLDADFEYGLQPTKWSAIGMQRGYPSIYEVPGSETEVQSVVTDASTGTEGVGASKITVTTQGAHGFTVGTPITIKALESSVTGASRAEGSFVIITVPTPTTFTYYAKAKVGDNDGDVLSTTYTQLRKGDFYTGADVGDPTFTVASNGTAGTMTLALGAQTGENRLAFTGDVPEIGAPIDYADIPVGSQVTAVSSTPDGNALIPVTTADITPGDTTFNVSDTTGIVVGLAADNGDGDAVFVTDITGNTVTMSGEFTVTLTQSQEIYQDVSGTVNTASGINAEFNISKTGTAYAVDSIAQGGSGYQEGDQILVTGDNIGGTTPANDATLTVTTADGTGSVTAASISGTALDGAITYNAVTSTYQNSGGTNLPTFDVTYAGGQYDTVTLGSPNSSTGWSVGDRIRVPGTSVAPGIGQIGNASSGGNDLVFKVTGVTGGSIDTVEVDLTDWSLGTPPSVDRTYQLTSAEYTGGSGTGFEVEVTASGVTYSTRIIQAGTGYTTSDTITITGNQLGGTSGSNDLVLRINDVGASGEVLGYREEGTDISSAPFAEDAGTFIGLSGTTVVGTGAIFDVVNDGSILTATVDTAGTGYHVGQTFLIEGTEIGGATPTNDVTVTVATIANLLSGSIGTVTTSGTAPALANSFSNISGTNQTNDGAGATFDVTRSAGNYINIDVDSGGTNYQVGNTIVLSGTDLGGASPANDAVVTVTSTNSGVINGATITGTAVSGDSLALVNAITMSEFTTAPITAGTNVPFEALATFQVEFENAHGIVPGATFIVDIDSDDGTNNHGLGTGAFIATSIPSNTTLTYQARSPGFIDTALSQIVGALYLRPDSFFIHRPYDGGVQLGTGGPQHGSQAIRQSKKYIRYQSGKGIMYTTGALFAPSYDIATITSNGTSIGSTITVTLDDNDHGMQVGGRVRIMGVETPGYNGNYTVTQIINERTFKALTTRRLGNTEATVGFAAQVAVTGWHGATVRSGIFDDQNGIYWEYDGVNIQVAQRTSTKQIAGTVSVTPDSSLITGTNTRFRDQLTAGDRIVIRGMTHVVSHVLSQTELAVTPDYRGVNPALAAKVCLVTDKKVKQDEFNLDTLDGTGPSGYNIDIAYMQMIGIQYSWYGAGFIDWMLRGSDGNFVFAHRMRNSNVNTEAFMRSGNLPVRYEVTNEGANGRLRENMTDSQTTVPLEDARFFPTSGTVYIDNELITFTGVDFDNNNLIGCTRAASLTNFQAGALRQYTAGLADTHLTRTGVVLVSNTITPLISHWGSAFITDGMFDDDRGYIFSYAETGLTVSTTRQTAFLLRLAPSVSNAITGDLGDRELLNRAQLLLQEMEITSDGEDGSGNAIQGGIVVEGILNPQNYPLNPGDVGWQGLSGVAQGGQPSFAQVASGGSVVWSSGDTSSTAQATVLNRVTVSAQMNTFQANQRRNYAYFYPTFLDKNLQVGDEVDDPKFPGGTTITQITNYTTYVFVRFSQRSTSNLRDNENVTFAFGGDLENRNFAYFTQASWEAGGAKAGTELDVPPTDQGDISFPAGTIVSGVAGPLLFGDPDVPGEFAYYYRVAFNNAASGTVSGGDNFNFIFRQPPYAQPGETVFSFIAVPGERSVLNLGQLKELTNTTLGGRGTFPNGPDVLAINVYKTSGVSLDANIIVKWGEAQA
jgi:hypothetical protein